jgi:hypothetical protein
VAYSVEGAQRRELQWDTAAIQRNALNIEQSFALSARQSPTASLSAYWAVGGNQNGIPYVFRLAFSSDTAIGWRAWIYGNAVGTTAASPIKLGQTSGTLQSNVYSGTVSSPTPHYMIDGGYVGAGSYTDLLDGAMLVIPATWYLNVVTDAVAANCSCTIWWAEYTD